MEGENAQKKWRSIREEKLSLEKKRRMKRILIQERSFVVVCPSFVILIISLAKIPQIYKSSRAPKLLLRARAAPSPSRPPSSPRDSALAPSCARALGHYSIFLCPAVCFGSSSRFQRGKTTKESEKDGRPRL